jgi:hypothetical protein
MDARDSDTDDEETNAADDRALCAGGVELPATEISVPEAVTPVSQLAPLAELPDVLEVGDGDRVDSAAAWREHRRPRLKALFRQYVYGYAPPAPRRTFDVEQESDPVLGGAATLKRVAIRFPDLPAAAPTPRLDLFVPSDADEPVPVVFGLNAFGNHAVADRLSLALPAPSRGADDPDDLPFGRGKRSDYWQVRETVERGYAFATACAADFDPDALDSGLARHVWEHRGEHPRALRGGTLANWAWGISRCVDYLREDPEIREDAVAAFGHSRAGKATLLAGATDERIAMVVPHQSGTGGVALSRHGPADSTGETVENIATTFPGWFDGYYPMFATAVDRFPMDQHHLVALVAPRAVLATESAPSADTWTNPDAARLSVRLASDAWELLDDRSIDPDAVSQAGGRLPADVPPVFHYRRDVEHTMTPEYWAAVYDFADQHLG